jgi:hypothetical protein
MDIEAALALGIRQNRPGKPWYFFFNIEGLAGLIFQQGQSRFPHTPASAKVRA